jgi:hypothetical protein
MIRAKVIDLPKEGITSHKLENIINNFIETEKPSEIISIQFDPNYGFLIIIYRKGDE